MYWQPAELYRLPETVIAEGLSGFSGGMAQRFLKIGWQVLETGYLHVNSEMLGSFQDEPIPATVSAGTPGGSRSALPGDSIIEFRHCLLDVVLDVYRQAIW
jgi:hypothetical protein